MIPKEDLRAAVTRQLIQQYEHLCIFTSLLMQQADTLACRVLASENPFRPPRGPAAEAAQAFRQRYLTSSIDFEEFEAIAVIARDVLLDEVPRFVGGIEEHVSKLQGEMRALDEPVAIADAGRPRRQTRAAVRSRTNPPRVGQ